MKSKICSRKSFKSNLSKEYQLRIFLNIHGYSNIRRFSSYKQIILANQEKHQRKQASSLNIKITT